MYMYNYNNYAYEHFTCNTFSVFQLQLLKEFIESLRLSEDSNFSSAALSMCNTMDNKVQYIAYNY